MKNILKTATLSIIAANALYAGGYKIPETSLNAIALSAANVAHSNSADASYYNPANMSFMENKNHIEVGLTYIGLSAVNFKGDQTMSGVDIDSDSETFFIPNIHYVSPKLGNFNIGFSAVTPGGLSKKWDDSPAVDSAEEFTLETIELNPSVSYMINSKLSIAAGLRVLYSSGVVKSSSSISRDLTGDSFNFGYNFALAYKPTKQIDLAVTYRTNIEMTEHGNAKLKIGNADVYDGGASVTIPLPATLNIAAAYTFETKTTVEFVYERNYWSKYSTLDFNYESAIPSILVPYFDDPIAKNWEDSNAFRLGVTQELEKMTLMMGVVYDQSPIPDETLHFETPDSDSTSVSLGGRYQFSDSLDIGLSALYSMRDDRTVNNGHVDGTFSDSNVLIISTAIGYKF
jgi:long-chain fatty acid transport protein